MFYAFYILFYIKKYNVRGMQLVKIHQSYNCVIPWQVKPLTK